MNMDVKIKDRIEEVEFLRMALVMAEIGVDYKIADLINRVSYRVRQLEGKYTINDSVEILYKWKEDWLKYDENQKRLDLEANLALEIEMKTKSKLQDS